MKRIFILAVLMMFLSFSGTHAQKTTFTTEDMIENCENKTGLSVYCIGMVLGVAAVMEGNRNVKGSWRMCITEFVSNKQMIRVFLNYAKSHPKRYQRIAQETMMIAFHETWRCK